ncbi:hypothetical protein K7G98_42745, partial [Saccharothrix sp. MB29]|nr:hypothetical protein [Saccharothrix sp. MB29]
PRVPTSGAAFGDAEAFQDGDPVSQRHDLHALVRSLIGSGGSAAGRRAVLVDGTVEGSRARERFTASASCALCPRG